jgi:hypothetical protein
MMARIAADLAADSLVTDLAPDDRATAEQAWDDANLTDSAATFAQGVAWAAQLDQLYRRGLVLRDDLPAQLIIDRQQLEHDRELADRDALIARLQATIDTQETEIRNLRVQSTAVGAALRNPRLHTAERVVGAVAIMELGSRASRGYVVDPWRPTIDAPKNPETPEDGQRVGLATELGLSRNTVARALDAFAEPGGPLQKQTVQERDSHGRVVRSRVELRPSPSCTGGVPGMYWALARFDPQRPKPEPPEVLICESHPEAKIRIRTVRTAICTADGEVIDEQATTITAPRPAPAHEFCASVVPTRVTSPGTYGERTRSVHRSVRDGDAHGSLATTLAGRRRCARCPRAAAAGSPWCRTCEEKPEEGRT